VALEHRDDDCRKLSARIEWYFGLYIITAVAIKRNTLLVNLVYRNVYLLHSCCYLIQPRQLRSSSHASVLSTDRVKESVNTCYIEHIVSQHFYDNRIATLDEDEFAVDKSFNRATCLTSIP